MEWICLDTGNPEEVERAAADVQQRFPALQVLINNAGIARMEQAQKGIVMDDVRQIVAINLTGVIGLTSALLK